MRLIHTSSVWGVGRRHRYYRDGKQISEGEFNQELLKFSPMDMRSERASSIHRTIWEKST